ncbi:TetR/AcrR family transcriptional regulator [Flexivirga sp. ID2601S]|uniref:TetR/AcrR family transcriptional regulator n=1 Tax=Flexivirga aerilata TaxID=1656889 RepID=A0A849AGS8_9MICO|nr:TetR/AcrR family transcriptional regulator [Flexivirga aerilata]NNG39067.1 TetR/AcrR family transcriptional regulator [Flexivirga aerilata]
MSEVRRSLPVAQAAPRVRRDAAANADRVLAAAMALVEAGGVDTLTMDRVAAEAGVGKGTVFRAFGNRSGLLAALTDETERDFQRAFLTGPPPLGPGAPPLDRLLAYGEGRLDLQRVHGAIFRAMQGVSIERFGVPARKVSVTHVRMLLRQCGIDDALDVITEAVLGPLDSDTAYHLSVERGLGRERLIADWKTMVRRLVG